MNDQAIRDLLARAADGAGEEFRLPSVEQFRARRRHRRRTVAASVASVAVVGVVAALSVTLTGGRSAAPSGHGAGTSTATSASPTASSLPSVGHVTAQQLQGYHWSALLPAPIAVRSSAASVWTGSQMIVWGGSKGGKLYADGATYTPATRTWQMLPPAPLSARWDPFAIWTGSVMIVWGGGRHDDGAMYNPATKQWTTMSAAPPAAKAGTYDFVWGGRFAVRLSLNNYFAATDVQVDAFDPTSNSWSSLPAIHVPAVRNYTGATAAMVGTQLVVWVSNGHSFALNAEGTAWQPVPYSPDLAGCIYEVIPTATSIIYPANYGSRSCGGDLAFMPGVQGIELNLATGHVRKIAYTPTSDAGSAVVWTGAALLNIASNPSHQERLNVKAGTTTAWDPTTNRWLALAAAPGWSGGDARSDAWVWTGTQLIGWGNFRPTHPGASASPGLTFSQ